MFTCYGTAIPYPIGPVYHTTIETNMEADICMPGVESNRLLFFLTVCNLRYNSTSLLALPQLSWLLQLTEIINANISMWESKITTILIAFQHYQTGALESPDFPSFRGGAARATLRITHF